MSEEQQQSLNEVATHPDTVPPVAHYQATMPRDYAIHAAPEISQDIFVPPLVAHPAHYDPHRVAYPSYYGPITSRDSATHVHQRIPCVPQPTMQLNNIVPGRPCGTTTATANGPPFFDIPFGGAAENTPVPSGRPPKRTRQDFNDPGHNRIVTGISMANIYRELATRFINDPQSNIIIIRMESSAGSSRVMIELEIVDNA